MSTYPETSAFESASILLPVVNETVSLRETVNAIMGSSSGDVREIIIIVCEKTTPQSMEVVNRIRVEHAGLVRVHSQKLPFLGGAMREAFEMVEASHIIMMASDLETDPVNVPIMIAESKAFPNAIIAASRWRGGEFRGYNHVKLIANWVFQKFFSTLYDVSLSDMTYGYRILPARLAKAIRWEELRHPFLFETLVKPLRLGISVIEIPAVWRARTEGQSQNTFFRNFAYIRTGLKCRFTPKRAILK